MSTIKTSSFLTIYFPDLFPHSFWDGEMKYDKVSLIHHWRSLENTDFFPI